jgi:tetratricopeptide (TPR) repeat protein
MGVVYEAVRVDDFSKRVALKLIRVELQTEALRARFEQERQLLAHLEHPFIARLLDGGETEEGAPFLVLEYVDGEPFLDHCARLSRPERLRVFLKVCEAVEHAHRNLVIHRDLKPTNILVTPDGDPKLLDFGIAKLVQTDRAFAETEFAALTPGYASPEQVLGRPMNVASDVYSLGVILYRILTGRSPYDLDGATAAQIERMICEAPPADPGMGDDLDAILLMALRKEPERRYGSARELARDIECYLGHLPVRARPDSLTYRARKFVRRRWPALLAAAAVVLTLGGGVAATLYQAQVARERFDQVRALAHSFVFDYGDDLAKIEGATAVRERMVRTALIYLDALAKSAGTDPALRQELAGAYQKVGELQGYPTRPNLGHTDQALATYATAAALWDQVAAGNPQAAGSAAGFYIDYARLLDLVGDAAGSARASARAAANLAIAGRVGAGDPYHLAQSWCGLGDADKFAASQLEKYHACRSIAESLQSRAPTFANQKQFLAGLIREGDALSEVGRLKDSLRMLGEVQTILDRDLASHPVDPELRKRQTMLAQLFSKVYYNDLAPSLGDVDHSIVYCRQYLEIARERVRRDPNDATSRFSQAVALFRLSFPLKFRDPQGAVAAAEESVRQFDRMIASGQSDALVLSRRARAQRRLAEALLFMGRAPEAARWAQTALAGARRASAGAPADADETANLILALISAARAADARRQPAVALARLREAEGHAARLEAQAPGDAPSAVLLTRARQELSEHFAALHDETSASAWARAARLPWRKVNPPTAYAAGMAASGTMPPR